MTRGNLILGAGGHGKVIADIMLLQRISVLGFLDDDPSLVGQKIFTLPVLGSSDKWRDFEPDGLVMGIGDNSIRRKIAQHMKLGPMPPWITVIHPNAIISASVEVSLGTVIMGGAVINADTVLGNHTIVNTGATVDHDCVIGHFVHIAPGANLAGGVYVNDGAFLGIGCSIIPNCRIGEGAIIGAGAVVVGDVPAGVIAKGVPARWHK
jgi:sugar O-acyltransferase (sialic acid O-acetyltransferase NeuD family)